MLRRLLLLASLLPFVPIASAAETPEDILKTDLMIVVAHPDDEIIAAGALTRYALGEGKVVATVHATRGEGGGNEVGTQLGPALGQLREAELRAAMQKTGVRHLYFLDETDWAYTESAAATLEKWGHQDALGKLVRIVRNLRPEILVTFMPAPTGGQHGHHQAAGILATEAFTAAADPAAFPDQIKREGLRPWQPKRLFYVGQHTGGPLVSVATDGKAADGRMFAEIAAEAMSAHKSQGFGNFGGFRGPARPSTFTLVKTAIPPDTLRPDSLLSGIRTPRSLLTLVEPVDYQIAPGQTGDLRVTLHNTGDQPLVDFNVVVPGQALWKLVDQGSRLPLPHNLQPGERHTATFPIRVAESAPSGEEISIPISFRASTKEGKGTVNSTVTRVRIASPIDVRVIPLPAITRYRDWTRSQQIERFAGALPSWVPFAAGQTGRLRVEVTNRAGGPQSLIVRPSMPTGWAAEPVSRTVTLGGRQSQVVEFNVTPPAYAKVADHPFKAEVMAAESGDSVPVTVAEGVAQVTPYAEIPRLARSPKIDGDLSDWAAGSELQVPSSNRVQGQFNDDADGSAVARLAYDDDHLYVSVRVRDEAVVSNIAPDDIKAHWRTDSVEITLDPTPRSESTLTTFKAGIFPWDTAGNVRAARDADANPGLIEETAPGMMIASKRTGDGYLLEVAIPWTAIGAKPESGKRLGFNLILYDGDQKDARVGDGIGEGRLAWSPRPGVWGRPEQWGEIRLR